MCVFSGETAFFRVRFSIADEEKPNYMIEDVANKTVHTIHGLYLATCYNFNVMAFNHEGKSSYMREPIRACALSELEF